MRNINFKIALLFLFICFTMLLFLSIKLMKTEENCKTLQFKIQQIQQKPKERKPIPVKFENWTEFNDREFPFLFKYPFGWKVKTNKNAVTVNWLGKDCLKCNAQEKKQFYEIFIGQQTFSPNTRRLSALHYVISEWLKSLDQDEEDCRQSKLLKKPCLPRIPGFTRRYKGEGEEFRQVLNPNSEFSIVEVTPYYPSPQNPYDPSKHRAKEFILVNHKNYDVFVIDLVSSNEIFNKENFIFEILKTFKFK